MTLEAKRPNPPTPFPRREGGAGEGLTAIKKVLDSPSPLSRGPPERSLDSPSPLRRGPGRGLLILPLLLGEGRGEVSWSNSPPFETVVRFWSILYGDSPEKRSPGLE